MSISLLVGGRRAGRIVRQHYYLDHAAAVKALALAE
jgi:hypothetical protein